MGFVFAPLKADVALVIRLRPNKKADLKNRSAAWGRSVPA